MFPYRLGLDLRGGVHIVLDAVDTKENPVTDHAIERTIAVLENRVNQLGVSGNNHPATGQPQENHR